MEPKITVELNLQQLNTILSGLAKLPLEQSMETFTTVRQQAEAQVNSQEVPSGPLADKVLNK
jgi:hypothetical protein